MTGVAGPRVEWIVSQWRNQTIPFRDMGIMALAAVDLAAGETEMLRFEIFVITVVAIQALVGDGFRQ